MKMYIQGILFVIPFIALVDFLKAVLVIFLPTPIRGVLSPRSTGHPFTRAPQKYTSISTTSAASTTYENIASLVMRSQVPAGTENTENGMWM